jgi:hypothetical protein
MAPFQGTGSRLKKEPIDTRIVHPAGLEGGAANAFVPKGSPPEP